MPKFGLIGFPLSHSFSKKYFSDKFEKENLYDFKYELFPIEKIGQITEVINKNPDLKGFNVTIPYKISVLPFLDEVDEAALNVGAVNTVLIKKIDNTKKLCGFNTDIIGFEDSLFTFIKDLKPSALILGTGGAARAVAYVLTRLGISFLFVSRNPEAGSEISYEKIDKPLMEQFHLIINTTPLGTYPEIDKFPEIPYNFLNSNHYLFDLVYNPSLTTFMAKGLQMGCQVKNGMEMLVQQAEASYKIWIED
jgi:shikimate dehydrogenase